jgi:hypothetical protein
MKGRKLFIVARDDANGYGLRLPKFRADYEEAEGPKELVILDGSSDAQLIFTTDQGERLMREILRFISQPQALPWRKVAQSGAIPGSGFRWPCKALSVEVAALGVSLSGQTILFETCNLALQEALSVRCRVISLPSLRSQTIPNPANG